MSTMPWPAQPRPWISGRDQKARVRRMCRVKTWRRRPIGREAYIGGAIAEEDGQRQDEAAADGPEAPEGALPAQRLHEVADQGRQQGGAQPARRPEDAGGEPQAALEPAT